MYVSAWRIGPVSSLQAHITRKAPLSQWVGSFSILVTGKVNEVFCESQSRAEQCSPGGPKLGLGATVAHEPTVEVLHLMVLIVLRVIEIQFNLTNMKDALRPYRMTKRAVSAAETTRKILAAAVDEFWDAPTPDLRLETIARRAGVTVQTILRQFGSKENLILEATKFEAERIRSIRDVKNIRSIEAAVHQLVDHYEAMGDRVLRMLAEESRLPALSQIVNTSRKLHRRWCRDVFAGTLNSLPGIERKVRLAQLVAICDVYTWKVLRRDSRLSAKATEEALIEMLRLLTKDK